MTTAPDDAYINTNKQSGSLPFWRARLYTYVRWLRMLGWPPIGRVWPTGLLILQKVPLLLTGPLDKALLGRPLVPSHIAILVFIRDLNRGQNLAPKTP